MFQHVEAYNIYIVGILFEDVVAYDNYTVIQFQVVMAAVHSRLAAANID